MNVNNEDINDRIISGSATYILRIKKPAPRQVFYYYRYAYCSREISATCRNSSRSLDSSVRRLMRTSLSSALTITFSKNSSTGSQRGQLNQRILITACGEIRLQLVAQHHQITRQLNFRRFFQHRSVNDVVQRLIGFREDVGDTFVCRRQRGGLFQSNGSAIPPSYAHRNPPGGLDDAPVPLWIVSTP